MIVESGAILRNAKAKATLETLDANSKPAYFLFFINKTDARANALARVACQSPAGSVQGGVLTLVGASGDVLLDGVPKWAKLYNGADDLVHVFDVSDSDGDGAIKLDRADVFAGGVLKLGEIILTVG